MRVISAPRLLRNSNGASTLGCSTVDEIVKMVQNSNNQDDLRCSGNVATDVRDAVGARHGEGTLLTLGDFAYHSE